MTKATASQVLEHECFRNIVGKDTGEACRAAIESYGNERFEAGRASRDAELGGLHPEALDKLHAAEREIESLRAQLAEKEAEAMARDLEIQRLQGEIARRDGVIRRLFNRQHPASKGEGDG